MRADRLVAAVLFLQARGRVTAGELARELEVSVRTARRDLEALGRAGIPVYSQAGKRGGWYLLGGARTDLSGLTAAEARTLFLVAGPSSTVAPEVKSALRKLVRALPETFRADAEAAASAVVIDPSRWGHAAPPVPPHLRTLERSVIDGVRVRIGYPGRTHTARDRTVHPLGLVKKDAAWYLVAGTETGLRTFRVDRIRSVTVTGERAIKPPDFDLAQAWRSVVARIDERRRGSRAVVRVSPEILAQLRVQFGKGVGLSRALEDGRLEVEIEAATAEMIAEQLAGWGRDVETIGPIEVRDHLVRIGRELLEQHSPSA